MGFAARRRVRAASWAALIAILCACALPRQAWAHAVMVKSSPSARTVLHRPPAKIQLWFNERLEARFSSFSLFDATGAVIEMGAVVLDAGDPKSLVAAVKPLPPGRYTVKYRVLSTDGHIVENQFNFTVRFEAGGGK